MHRFHFNDKDVDFDELKTWFALRNASFSLMNVKTESEGFRDWHYTYDISVMSDEVSVELALTFEVKRDESKLMKLKRERKEIINRIKALKLK
jgi:N-dimethylarginine dimethylaminohydrolase